MSKRYPVAFEFVKEIDVEKIEVITLVKLLRKHYDLNLSTSLDMARLLKEVHRVGVIRGQVVNK